VFFQNHKLTSCGIDRSESCSGRLSSF